MEKNLFLIRGLPGSGKSTVAKMFGTKAICSADDYFMRDGEYKWDADKISIAHNWCQRKCISFMKMKTPEIVVDNTFTREWEMSTYYRLATEFGYKVFSIIVENRHGGVNTHGIPEETIETMRERFEIKI